MQPMVISFALKTGAMQNIKGARVEEIADMLRDGTETLWLDFNLGETWQAYLSEEVGGAEGERDDARRGDGRFRDGALRGGGVRDMTDD